MGLPLPLSSHQSLDVRLMSKTAKLCGSRASLDFSSMLATSDQHNTNFPEPHSLLADQ